MQFVFETLMNENQLATDEGLVMSLRLPKHATRVLVVSHAAVKHFASTDYEKQLYACARKLI